MKHLQLQILRSPAVLVSGFFVVAAAIVMVAITVNQTATVQAQTPSSSFVFAAGGDHANSWGTSGRSSLSANQVAASGAAFYQALGDLSYSAGAEASWCSNFKSRFNNVVLLAGNHDVGESSGGSIANYSANCPYPAGMPPITGTFTSRFHYDYPSSKPIARFIMITPGVRGSIAVTDQYGLNGAGYNYTSDAIDSARAAGIKWIIVGMHKNCITVGEKGCSDGSNMIEINKLLYSKKVDLILQGHEHDYQRSKQLAINSTTCPTLVTGSVDADCIVDDGADGQYVKGAGSVLNIIGTFGQGLRTFSATEGVNNPEAGYFASVNDNTYGIMKFSVTETSLTGQFLKSGGTGNLADTFTISSGPVTPPPADTTAPAVTLTAPANGASVSGTIAVTATATDNTGGSGVKQVEFFDGNTSLGVDTTAPYSVSWNAASATSGPHSIKAIATDNASPANSATSNVHAVTVSTSCPAMPMTHGAATMTVNVPAAGTYRIWSRIKAADSTSNSYYFQVDTGNGGNLCGVNIGDNASLSPNDWTWVDYKNASTATKAEVVFATSGTHTLNLIGREAGVKLDRVLLLSDTCVPTGTGDNCTNAPDTIAPTIGSLNVPTSSPQALVNITTTATDNSGGTGVAKVDFYVDDILTSIDNTPPSPFSFSWNAAAATVGVHTIKAIATDGANLASAAVTKTITITDTTNPTTALVSPSSPLSGFATLSATASDNVGITKVEFYLGNTLIGTSPSSASPYTYTWDTKSVANGTHGLITKAYDAAGNVATSAVVNVTVDNDITPPNTTITSQPAASTTSTTADFNFTSSETGTFSCKLDNAVFTACSSPKNYTGLSVGTHMFSVQATDNVGNTDLTPATYTWSVGDTTPTPIPDQTPPSVSITTPASGSTVSGTITASAAATDNVGVTGVQFKLDDVNVGTEDTSAPYQYSRNTLSPALANGTHTITAVARDAAGNSTTAAMVSFTVNNGDLSAPTAPTSLRTTATPTTTSVSLAWNAATDNVGVTRYNILRNGVVIAILDSPTLTFIDTSLSASTNYSYVVQAVDAAGNTSPNSNTLSTTTAAPPQTSDATKPTVPTLTLAVASSTQINLSWTASTDSSGIRGYNVYRYTQDPVANPSTAATKLNSTLLPNNSLSFGSTNLNPSTTYFYRVEAIDNSTNLNTSQSTPKSATTQAPPAPTPTPKPGDMTGPSGSSDGVISIEDISYVIRAIQAYNANPATVDPKADVSGPNGVPDGKISIEDISYVIRNYGK